MRATWLEIGQRNPWIRHAYDPAFGERSFVECGSLDELVERIWHGNWCLGTAFYWRDICMIEQTNGDGEWLVVKADRPFECFSVGMGSMEKGRLRRTLTDIDLATVEECTDLRYSRAVETEDGLVVTCSSCAAVLGRLGAQTKEEVRPC